MSETLVRSVGVVITNGVGRLHTSNETGEKAGFNKVAVPMPGNGKPWIGRFVFVALPKAMSKLEAAEYFVKSFGQAPSTESMAFIDVAKEAIAAKAPKEKAPRKAKAPKVERKLEVKVEKKTTDAQAAAKLKDQAAALQRLRQKANDRVKEVVA